MKTIFTIGHSNRTIEDFLELLSAHKIKAVADVRRFPGSRAFPQFGQEALKTALAGAGIEYHWFEGLGGRRSTRQLSARNSAWEVDAFHAYADYTETAAFRDALKELEQLARRTRTAYMCAEALWTRCHRRIISDVLSAEGWGVKHILSPKRVEPHKLPEFARVEDGRVSYPGLF